MNEALWKAVHEALDQRRDPLRDSGVEAQLTRHPQQLESLLAFLERLEDLPRPAPRLAWHRAWLSVAGGLLLAFALTWAGGFATKTPPPKPSASPGRVLSWRVSITRESLTGFARTVSEDGRVRTEVHTQPEDGARVAVLTNHWSD